MADKELIIKIPEEDYKRLVYMDIFRLQGYIKNGVALPKRHGRIGDLDQLIQTMKELNDDNGGEPLNAVDRGYDLAYQHMVEVAKECVIIETDKEKENESIS